MAMTAFEIFGILKLDSSEFNKGLSDAEGKAGSFLGSGLTKAAKIGAAAVATATGAVTAFGKASMNEAASYESAFTGVKKTTELTAEEYNELSNWIMEASTRMASSKEDIAGTMEIAGQLGIDGVKELEKFTETMVMLGDTTNLSSEEAAGALARMMNITGESAEDADKMGSVIVDLGNHFATTESDIVSMATRLSGAGTQFGLSGAEILGIATALSSVGIQAEMGGSAFSKAMIKMQVAAETGYDRVNEVMAETGYTLRELELMQSNNSSAFKALADSMGMTKGELGDVIKSGKELQDFAKVAQMDVDSFVKLFREDSTQALQAFVHGLGDTDAAGESTIQMLQDMGFTEVRLRDTLTRLANSGDLITDSVNMATEAWKENNAITEEANLRYSTTESAAMQTREALKNLQVMIGQELMPTYSEFLSFSKQAMADVQKGLEEGGMSGMMEAVGTALSDALGIITEKLPEFVNMGMQLLSALGQGLIDNIEPITESATEIMIILGTKLVEALPYLVEKAPEIISGFVQGLINALEKYAPEFAEKLSSVFGWIQEHGEEVKAIIVGIVAAFATFKTISSVVGIIQGVITAISAILTMNPIGLIVAAIAGLVAAFVYLWNTSEEFRNFWIGLWDGIKGAFNTAVEWIKNGIENIKQFFSDLKQTVNNVWESFINNSLIQAFVSYVTSTFENLKKTLSGIWDGIKDIAHGAWTIIKNIILAPVLLLIDLVTGNFDKMKKDVEKIWDNLTKSVQSIWNGLKTIVVSVAKGIWDQVKLTFNTLKDGVVSIFTNVKDTVGSIVTNLVDSVRDKVTKLPEIISENFTKAMDFIKEFPSKALTWGADLISNFIQGIKDKWGELKDGLGAVGEKITDFIGFSEPKEGPLSKFHTFAPDMMKLFIQGIKDNEKMLQDQLADTFDFKAAVSTTADIGESTGIASRTQNNNNNIVMNIYATAGQDVDELAEIIKEKIEDIEYRDNAAWGLA